MVTRIRNLVAATDAGGPDPWELHLFVNTANGEAWTMSNVATFMMEMGDPELADLNGDGALEPGRVLPILQWHKLLGPDLSEFR